MRTDATFDYIVIGGGTAGCALASRLSEDPGVTVLLLEAGSRGKTNPKLVIPAAYPDLFRTEVDWDYATEAQPGLDCRPRYWPRGRVLGGSGAINSMVYIRGTRRDYDGWEELGNRGWGYSSVLPYFKRAEDQERGADEYHGAGGPLRVADLREVNPISRAFVEACTEVGHPRNVDFNGAEQLGAGFYQVTQRRGRRENSATAYLGPALCRRNLTVHTRAQVTRLIFEGRRAVGVAYLEDGTTRCARAGREVLLCGGSINSPQLLMLSGIGPEDHLKCLGIPILADLPGVGQNLQDHIGVPLAYQCLQPVSLMEAESLWNLLRFAVFGRGPLTSNLAEAGAFLKSRPDRPAPDLQFYCAPAYYVDHGFTRPEGHWFTVGAAILCPDSRGSITLRSRNPFEAPAILAGYLQHRADEDTLVEGVRMARRIVEATAMDAFRGREAVPGPQVQSDAEIRAFIRAFVETTYHPVGTCKMGGDGMAVVNDRLEVHGVEGLRVVDGSIMPTLIGGNTAAPILMIAEKAADIIKSARS